MSSFISTEVPASAARRTVRVHAVRAAESIAPAIVGTGLTFAAVFASVLAFAAM